MEPQQQPLSNDSQMEDNAYFSQSNFSPSPYTQSPYFGYGAATSPVSMAFTIPHHGFGAMLTATSPTSPMMFAPAHHRGIPPIAPVGTAAPQSQATLHLAQEGTPNLVSTKPSKNARINTLTKEGAMEVGSIAPKRRRTSKAKGKLQGIDEANDAEKKSNDLWRDFWVEHLVHIRGGMNNDFNKMPKQGVDLWGKVAIKLASMFSDFDKDAEACRKKWQRVNKMYREDKAHNAISGNDRKKSCKWYDIVDEYMHDRANVVCKSHASSLEPETQPDNESFGKSIQQSIDVKDNTKDLSTTRPGRGAHLQDDPLYQLADSGRALVSHMKEEAARRASMEERRQSTFEALQACMASFLEIAKKE